MGPSLTLARNDWSLSLPVHSKLKSCLLIWLQPEVLEKYAWTIFTKRRKILLPVHTRTGEPCNLVRGLLQAWNEPGILKGQAGLGLHLAPDLYLACPYGFLLNRSTWDPWSTISLNVCSTPLSKTTSKPSMTGQMTTWTHPSLLLKPSLTLGNKLLA